MYISDLDQIKARLTIEGKLKQSEIIKLILNDFSIDVKTSFMDVGQRYYVGEHDILKHNFQQSQVYDSVPADESTNGKEHDTISMVINKNNSNMHNVNPFHRLLVTVSAARRLCAKLLTQKQTHLLMQRSRRVQSNSLRLMTMHIIRQCMTQQRLQIMAYFINFRYS